MKRLRGDSFFPETNSMSGERREVKRRAHKCYYSVIHYLPSLVRGESINIGIILQCAEEQSVRCRVVKDLEKIRRLDPEVDPDIIESVLMELDARFNTTMGEKAGILNPRFLHKVAEEYANHIQLTRPRLCVTKNLEEELDFLYRLFVEESKGVVGAGFSSFLKKEIRNLLVQTELDFQEDVRIALPYEVVKVDFELRESREARGYLIQIVDVAYGTLLRAKEWAFNFGSISVLPAYQNYRFVCVLGTSSANIESGEELLKRAQLVLQRNCHQVLLGKEVEQWLRTLRDDF